MRLSVKVQFIKNFLNRLRLITFFAKVERRFKQLKGEGRQAVIFEIVQFLLVCGILVLVLASFWRTAKNIQNDIFEKRRLAAAIEQRVESERSLRKDYELTGEVIPRLNTFFPTIDDLPIFLNKIDDVGNIFGATVVLDLGQQSSAGEVSALPFIIKTNLSVSSLVQFFEEFAKLPYIVTIQLIELIAPEGIQTNGAVKISATLFMK